MYEGKSWATWMDELDSRAENTRIAYLKAFNTVADEWDMTPEEMFEEKMRELKSEDPRDRMGTEKRINKFMKELVDGGTSPEGARMIKKALNSFYSAQGLILLFKKNKWNNNGHKGQKAISRDQIRMLIETNGIRNIQKNSALYNILNDSGLRVSDVASMTVGAYREAETVLNNHDEAFKVFDPERTRKCGVVAYIHLGPEAVSRVDAYLAYRQERGEVLTDDSPLFIDREGRKYTEKRLSNTISTTCGLRGLRRISAHSFRKRHKTQLERYMPVDWIYMLQGKTFSEYSQPSEEELTEAFIKNYHAIRVYGDEVHKTLTEEQFTEFQKLKKTVARYEPIIQSLMEEKRERDRLREASMEP